MFADTPSDIWTRVVAIITDISPVSQGQLREDARLVCDLQFDSLTLAELVLALIADLDCDISDQLDRDRWTTTTVADVVRLCKECTDRPKDARYRFLG